MAEFGNSPSGNARLRPRMSEKNATPEGGDPRKECATTEGGDPGKECATAEGGDPGKECATTEGGDPGKEFATAEGGGPGVGPRGWHSRGYMPHFDSNDVIQHVTFHLADSLPKEAIARIAAELAGEDPEHREIEKRRRLEALSDACHGACWLRRPDCAREVQNALLHFDGERYRLLAWVVMPNHVHALFQTLDGWEMGKVVASWKSWTGRQISEMILRERHSWEREAPASRFSEQREDGASQFSEQREDGASRSRQRQSRERRPMQVWHPEYWDRYIRNERHYAGAIAYIHENPVKAGLVRRAEDWPWSSAGEAGNARLRPRMSEKNATAEGGGPGEATS